MELNPNEQEKKDLVAFMRARQASDSGLNGGHDRSPGVSVYTLTPHPSPLTAFMRCSAAHMGPENRRCG